MIKSVVFFVLGMSPRIDRRIREFVKNGFDVEVYGGSAKSSKKYEVNDVYKYNVLYELGEKSTYLERLRHFPQMLKIIKEHDKRTTLFYFFSLNVATLIWAAPRIKYIYEESDMLFDRFRNSFLRKFVIHINKRIIKKSVLTVFTSEGFADYYYGDNKPTNLVVIPNRVSPDCIHYPSKGKEKIDFNKLKIGFAGNVRYQSILNVSDVVVEKFDGFVFHYFGDTIGLSSEQVKHIQTQPRVFIHGSYKYPSGLAEVYDSLDFIVCTYDATGVNPQYAEPNKLYEAIFYNTPIIVSSNTFLAKKVEKLGIGFSVDANDKKDIYNKLKSITPEKYKSYVDAIKSIPKEQALNINDNFFKMLKENLNNDVSKITPPSPIRLLKRGVKGLLILVRKPLWFVQKNSVPFSSYVQTTSKMRNTKMGKYCYVSAFCGLNKVRMGNYCSIGPSVLIGNMEHDVNDYSTSPRLSNSGRDAEVIIGNDVWIGAQSFIRIGVKIGDGAVVGAQSFVNKDVPPYAIVVGTPAKILRYRFDEDTIRNIQKTKYWDENPETAKALISQIEIK